MRARQKLILQPVPKSLESDIDEDEDDEDFGVASKSTKREMSDATIKSSPVWMIFKSHDQDDLKVKCTICEKVFVSSSTSDIFSNIKAVYAKT